MTTWKLLFLWLLPCYQTKDDEAVYECGAHGRFEYCIDGIPGCVVGCHCHPGYYFDTETKICESNTKLTQNYRRYIPEPTRIQNPNYALELENTATIPTLTTRNIIDEQVNDITKNADDLGDWLYNQFFKTIENQVINKTNKDSPLTRRSGHSTRHNKSKRRSKKKSKKRHRKKKKGMREKLLQITEDDSLFQTSDSSDSDDDSTSSDFSRSYSSSESDSDEDHGHKKIVVINKKPRPPLPSFIFLPNMDTPFYPPIGLPPPPVMPMYPAVPVPPVMPAPPMFPLPGPGPDCQETTSVSSSTTTVTTTTTTTTTTEESSTTTESDIPTEEAPPDNEESSTIAPEYRIRPRGKKRKQLKPHRNIPNDEEDTFDNFKPSREGRHKLLQRLRERMSNSRLNLKRNRKPQNNYPLTPPDNSVDSNNVDDMVFKNENSLSYPLKDEPDQDNVDFKYLSQLIHRVNESQIQDVPLNVYNPQVSHKTIKSREWSAKKRQRDYNIPIGSGRRMSQPVNIPSLGQPDDTYYSNLGRQIASLIRTIDVDNEREMNIEIEKVQQNPESAPFFNENAPRTFWERSVRSPLKYICPFKTRYDYLKNSNELLFNIESKVETVASTVPTLTLQQIENMINVMQSAQSQFRRNTKIKNVNPASKTLNINLWPQEIKQAKNSIKSSARSNVLNINKRKFINYSNNTKPEILNTKLNIIKVHNIHTFPDQPNGHKLRDGSANGNQIEPILKSTSTNLYFIRNRTETTYSHPMRNPNPFNVHKSQNLHYNLNPAGIKYRNIKKYFFDDNNHSFQNDNLLF